MRIRKPPILSLLFSVVTLICTAQNTLYDKYPFINADIDTIHYKGDALKSFFVKLKELKEGKRKNVVIVHIGDSHLQADFFSGMIRQHLQRDYGNAGRGLIFPYHVAGSNEPFNYRSSSTGEWKGRRCVLATPTYIRVGISGFGLRTDDSSATLKINVKSNDSLNYSFNHMLLFHDAGPHCFNWVVYTSRNHKDSVVINDSAAKYGSAVDSIVFKDTMQVLSMCVRKSDTSKFEASTFGMVLTNNQPGILYHTIGANGARNADYTHSEYFIQQLAALHPDLVIISLGTNEAYARNYSTPDFENDMDTLYSNIKQVAPDADFLYTTPNDSYRNHKYKNPDVAEAAAAIKRTAEKHNAAYWDFYHIMGGFGSMQKWYLKHLSQRDRVHFTVGGYTLQADLFYQALHKTIIDGLDKLAP